MAEYTETELDVATADLMGVLAPVPLDMADLVRRRAATVLDAAAPLIAARVRAQVAEEIATVFDRMRPGVPRRDAAAIARAHATTEEDPNAA